MGVCFIPGDKFQFFAESIRLKGAKLGTPVLEQTLMGARAAKLDEPQPAI